MAKYITEIDVSLNDDDMQALQTQGFQQISVNLNSGTGGNEIFLWFKRGEVAITRMQVSFTEEMSDGLNKAGYMKINKNLNTGNQGNTIFLWYLRGTKDSEYDTPIVELSVTSSANEEAAMFKLHYERVGCDLNRLVCGGDPIYVWVKREKTTYICDVMATDNSGADKIYFQEGYIRVDEDLNRGVGDMWIFLWYRQTTFTENAINDLEISNTDAERNRYSAAHYTSVNVNLNEGTRGEPVFLWYKKNAVHKPIQNFTVLVNKAAVNLYSKAGMQVIKKNLNTGNAGVEEYLAYYQ